MEIFLLTIKQMSVLMIFMAIGFVLKKGKIIKENLAAVLSKLETVIFLPLVCFNSFSSKMTLENLATKWPFLVVCTVLVLLSFVIGIYVGKVLSKDKLTESIITYGLTVANIAYIGYPIIEGVFGGDVLFEYILFCIPHSVFSNTVGAEMLKGNTRFNYKAIFNPLVISIILGTVFGLTGIALPDTLKTVVSSGAACMSPIAMILSGFVLAKSNFKTVFNDYRVYIVAALRMVAMPALFGALVFAVCRVAGLDTVYAFFTLTSFCMPTGLGSVIFPESVGRDSSFSAKTCCICYLFGIVTIPLAFSVASAIVRF